jgi:hypothetical protein
MATLGLPFPIALLCLKARQLQQGASDAVRSRVDTVRNG